MKKVQQGFTLIELMIVIAIIGILAAIALPAYQDYVGRAQATEGLTATAGLRAELGVYLAENGDFSGVSSGAINTVANALEGNYFSANGVSVNGNGEIDIIFDNGVHSGDTLTLRPDQAASGGQISGWTCSGLNSQFLPAACQ